jgi:hypothetical protein
VPPTPEPLPGTSGGVPVDEWRALRASHLDAKAKLARARKDCDRLLHEVKGQHKVGAGAGPGGCLAAARAERAPGGPCRLWNGPKRELPCARQSPVPPAHRLPNPQTPCPLTHQLLEEQARELASARGRALEAERLAARLADSERVR